MTASIDALPKTAPIQLDSVSVSYVRQTTPLARALHNVSGCFAPGSLTAIVGPNGAGKSTLLKALMGEFSNIKGKIMRNGLSVRDFAFLPQVARIDRQFPLNVADTVMLGAWSKTGALCAISSETAQKAHEALATVGLVGCERRHIGSLSSGQFQRVLFARLLLQDAGIIILDEPFFAVDMRTTRDLLHIVQNWHRQGRTVIAVLHDLSQVRKYFPSTLLLAREVIAWGPTENVLNAENISQAYIMAETWDETGFQDSESQGDYA